MREYYLTVFGLQVCCAVILLQVAGGCAQNQASLNFRFPAQQLPKASFNRPAPGEILDISPPGFCWWRAGKRGEVLYRLEIREAKGAVVYTSALLEDPIHVPSEALPPGTYTWTVSALADGDRVVDTLAPRSFTITEHPIPMPWMDPKVLLDRVPKDHPRLLFPKASLPEVRDTLDTTRKEAFIELKAAADAALDFDLMDKPDFDKYDRKTEYPARRVAYRQDYHEFTRIYLNGVLPMALMYLLTEEEQYGQAAKAHLLNLLDWETEGIASLESSFDEIGLRIERVSAQLYDWLYDLLSEQERDAVKQMLIDHGNLMLQRLNDRDFLNFSGSSHDGRLPGYLVEFSIALAEEPDAPVWLDYALKSLMTVFPHWAGQDGGWAEGVPYSISYNTRFITPLESLRSATGLDLWQKPFFRKFRYFPVYNVAPRGEVLPFGDGEQRRVDTRADDLSAMLQFHALRFNDPVVRWWVDLLERDRSTPNPVNTIFRIILPDTVTPAAPTDFPQDRAFFGVGWAALHSNLANPAEDLMVMFKSSPFGAVSHGHAEQNSFVIMKGGKALAIPGGERYPQHGSPFHVEYTRHTVAHNALLINGEGQINRDGTVGGRLVGFKSLAHLGYVSGDAQICYGELLSRYERHIVLIRPSIILVVDDLEAPRPVDVAWLMHAKEKLELNPDRQRFLSRRGDLGMIGHLYADGPLSLDQTDAWPLPPKTDYPMVTAPEPANQWHFTAKTLGRRDSWRIAAVLAVGESGVFPDYEIVQAPGGVIEVHAVFGEGMATAIINIAADRERVKPLMEVNYEPVEGDVEWITVP